MKINWAIRVKNPWFWISLIGVVFSPVLAAMGITEADLTTWNSILDVIKTLLTTPYLVFAAISAILGFLGISADMTTKGLNDSPLAMSYDKPKEY